MIEEVSTQSDVVDAKSPRHPRDANRIPPFTGRDPFVSPHRQAPSAMTAARIAGLEFENLRLQRLVAELLIKNQQLRKCD